jgi:hypothetical protein
MKNLNKVLFVWILVGFSVLVWLLLALRASVTISDGVKLLKLLPTVIAADAIALGVFVKWLWRCKLLHGWLVPFPDLNGTWQGTIKTTWVDPKTGEHPAAIPVILCIKQSFISISCVMRTREMTSHSYCSDFVLDADSQLKKLAYSYKSWPRATVVDRSPPHDGTIIFDIVGDPPHKLNGQYWTARKTTGEIDLTYRCKECLEEFPSDLAQPTNVAATTADGGSRQ